MDNLDQVCDEVINRRLQKIRADYDSDPQLRKKQLSFRLTQLFKQHIEIAKTHDWGGSHHVLIGKHFSYEFIQCCSRNGVGLLENAHLIMANNPQVARGASPFMTIFGEQMKTMVEECNQIAKRLQNGDFEDYLLYRQKWWDTEGGFDMDYIENLFLGTKEVEDVKGGIQRLTALARARFELLSRKNT